MDKQISQIMDDIDKDLAAVLPQIAERMKKRVYLAYLYGTQENNQDTPLKAPQQLHLSLPTD